ncbi:MFS transporter [Calditerrivibrio nitroreducens]|uniref:Major facilitator superfamily MFS_1 n=1 Tax=Calditerrivibrio nitroreducens (strain DSM 19672 / NBRC 101217 / Yu37-1) TaxID=768670 RepID=E4TEZ4_CALNY|nr:MFS transporter [Calditerrivibrio nitroreducens]ADR18400.1 major facilitator superfamily MFS_1 [Calditerrivibrio nitroreducens DSM 19672]
MRLKDIFFVVYTAVLTFSVLYSPQPLLPVLMKEFGVDKSSAALITTVTMLPLSLSPIIYGFILEKLTARRVMFFAISILVVLEISIYFINEFYLLIFVRLLQGFLIPGVLTSLMTFVSMASEKSLIQRVMSYYIAATILGGFLGRFISGLISKLFGWRYGFLILGFSLAISFVLLFFISDYKIQVKDRITLKNAMNVIKTHPFLNIYITIFCTFFVFAAMLNFIPFRLKEISDNVSEFIIGLSYSGYVMGIIVSLFSMLLIKFFKSEKKVILYGLMIYLISIPIFSVKSISFIFFAMFVFCTGMFTVHSIASGFLNKLAISNKGIVNGLYVSFYYTGGVLGTFLPGYLYKSSGWNAFLILLSALILIGVGSAVQIRQPHS